MVPWLCFLCDASALAECINKWLETPALLIPSEKLFNSYGGWMKHFAGQMPKLIHLVEKAEK